MAGRIISIEIGYSLTRVCETDYKAKTHRIYNSFTVPTPEGVINDGALSITPEYVEELKKAFAENKIKAKQVLFTITSAKIASREVVIPFVKENRIADVVKANAGDYFPVDLSQYQLAYSILGKQGDPKGQQQYKLAVMAAPLAMLDGYYDLAKALKLELAALDYAGNSVYQLVRGECAQGVNMIVKIDERSAYVMVVQDGVLSFSRNVAYGVEETIQTVMEQKAFQEADTVQKAMEILGRENCVGIEEPGTEEAGAETDAAAGEETGQAQAVAAEQLQGSAEEQEAKKAVTEALLPLVNGIARVIDYYVSRNAQAPIDRILLTGLGGNIRGLDVLFAKETNYQVAVLKEVAGWNLAKDFQKEWYGEYIACAGAGAAPMGFCKESEKSKKQAGKSKTAGGKVDGAVIAYAVLAIGVIAGVAMTCISTVKYVEAQKKNVELKAESAKLEEIIPIYNEYVTTKSDYNKVTAMYETTQNNNDSLYEFMLELEESLPSKVSVIAMESTQEGISINMSVPTKGEAAATVEQIRTFHSLRPESVRVASIVNEEDEESTEETINFTVTAEYKTLEEQAQEQEEAAE